VLPHPRNGPEDGVGGTPDPTLGVVPTPDPGGIELFMERPPKTCPRPSWLPAPAIVGDRLRGGIHSAAAKRPKAEKIRGLAI
jgi:hypothetical protein